MKSIRTRITLITVIAMTVALGIATVIGVISIRKLARETGGIGCRQGSNMFLLYCPQQKDYEQLFRGFLAGLFTDQEIADRISLRFGVFADARQEEDVEERFICAKIAADRVKEDPGKILGFYDQAS